MEIWLQKSHRCSLTRVPAAQLSPLLQRDVLQTNLAYRYRLIQIDCLVLDIWQHLYANFHWSECLRSVWSRQQNFLQSFSRSKSLGYSRSFLLKGDWLVFGVGLKWTLKELHCWFNSLVAWFTFSLCSILCSKFSTDLLLKCVSCHLPTGLLRDCCPCG